MEEEEGKEEEEEEKGWEEEEPPSPTPSCGFPQAQRSPRGSRRVGTGNFRAGEGVRRWTGRRPLIRLAGPPRPRKPKGPNPDSVLLERLG